MIRRRTTLIVYENDLSFPTIIVQATISIGIIFSAQEFKVSRHKHCPFQFWKKEDKAKNTNILFNFVRLDITFNESCCLTCKRGFGHFLPPPLDEGSIQPPHHTSYPYPTKPFPLIKNYKYR